MVFEPVLLSKNFVCLLYRGHKFNHIHPCRRGPTTGLSLLSLERPACHVGLWLACGDLASKQFPALM